MKKLFEKLLLEENGFEDAIDSTEIDQEDTLDDSADTGVADEESVVVDDSGEDVGNVEATSTTYKVSFTLGNHENWSRVDASSEQEAEQLVRDYVTKKWPNRDFSVIEVGEFDESELEETLDESLNENVRGQGEYSDKFHDYAIYLEQNDLNGDAWYLLYQLIRYCKEEDLKDLWVDRMGSVAEKVGFGKEGTIEESLNGVAEPIETGAFVGMASVISDLIKDEYEAIDGYNSAIATAEAEGFGDMVTVLSEIQAEENLHIGQLQTLMTMVDPNAHLVDDGKQEGIEQLSNPIMTNEDLNENVEIGRPDYSVDMSDEEYEEFRELLTKHYGSPAEFFKRLHSYKPDFEIHNVDYDDIEEECVTLSSADISQGTGNVIVYTAMGKDTGKIYRYADF